MFLLRTRCFYRCIAATAFAVLILIFHAEVRADTPRCPAVPEPINSGFRAYQFKGGAAAVLEWTYKSAFANQTEMDSLVAELSVLRNKYGDIKSYRTIGVDRISPNTSIYYIGAGQERGEIFFKWVYYCEKDEWVLADRPQIHSDPDFVISQNYYLRLIKELQEAVSKKGK